MVFQLPAVAEDPCKPTAPKSASPNTCEYCAIRNLSMIMELCRMTMSELTSGHNGCCTHESEFDFGDFLGKKKRL